MYDYEKDVDAILVNIAERKLKFDRYDVNKGQELKEKQIYCNETEGKNVYTDYIANNLAWFVVSERLKDMLLEFNIGDTEFIPLLKENTEKIIGYLANIINTVDAIDLSKSLYKKMTYHREGKEETYNSIIKYALIEKEIGERDLFRLDGYNTSIFISERLKNAMNKAKMTGCDFQKVKVS
jgi:hypothetical protein